MIGQLDDNERAVILKSAYCDCWDGDPCSDCREAKRILIRILRAAGMRVIWRTMAPYKAQIFKEEVLTPSKKPKVVR